MSKPLETRPRPRSEWVQKRPMTYEEFLEWADEDTLAEWVDGVVVMTSPASTRHQKIANFLIAIFSTYAEIHGLGEIFDGPFQMKLPRSGREPDVLFIAEEHLARLKRTYLDGPADLVVEIISPESEERDRSSKFYEYQDAGVPEYRLVDPGLEQASFYQLDDAERYQQVAPDEAGSYHSRALPGFWLRVAWSPDGSRLASASEDGTVRLWEATTGRCLFIYQGHTGPVRSVAWSPDGSRMASASEDMTVQVWSAG